MLVIRKGIHLCYFEGSAKIGSITNGPLCAQRVWSFWGELGLRGIRVLGRSNIRRSGGSCNWNPAWGHSRDNVDNVWFEDWRNWGVFRGPSFQRHHFGEERGAGIFLPQRGEGRGGVCFGLVLDEVGSTLLAAEFENMVVQVTQGPFVGFVGIEFV